MRKVLLRAALIGCGVLMLTCVLPQSELKAQESNQQAMKEMPNPEKAAKRRANAMQETLGLTDKQYKKVYKLILAEENEMFEMSNGGPRQQGGMPSGGHGGGMGGPGGGMGGPGGGMGGFGGGMGGPGGGMGPGGGGMPPQGMGGSSNKDPRETMIKNAEKREKKMKKILSEEQYAQYQVMREQQREEQRKQMEQNRPPMGGPQGEHEGETKVEPIQ